MGETRTPSTDVPMTPRPIVIVAIPTFRRPSLLCNLLEAIAAQEIAHEVDVTVIVFDNDADRSAETVVTAVGEAFPFRLEYEHVVDPGLASVRNRSLARASEVCDYLAMIDDDEVPEPQWLSELLAKQFATGAEVVVGPVPPILPASAPVWLHEYRARELPIHPDGTLLDDGWSGNCLLEMAAIGKLAVTFDRGLNFAGGEDQLFFRQIRARGGRIAYAARAIAWEETPPQRQSLRFILLRSFRRGNTLALCDLRMYGRMRATLVRTSKAFATIARGIAKGANAGRRRELSGAVDGACDVCSAFGMLYRLAGLTYEAYRPAKNARSC